MPQLASGRHVGFTTDPLLDWIRDASPDETLRLLASGFSEEDLLSMLFLVEYGEADFEPPTEANPGLGKPRITRLTIRRVLDGEGAGPKQIEKASPTGCSSHEPRACCETFGRMRWSVWRKSRCRRRSKGFLSQEMTKQARAARQIVGLFPFRGPVLPRGELAHWKQSR
jgi:hypothetical protein